MAKKWKLPWDEQEPVSAEAFTPETSFQPLPHHGTEHRFVRTGTETALITSFCPAGHQQVLGPFSFEAQGPVTHLARPAGAATWTILAEYPEMPHVIRVSGMQAKAQFPGGAGGGASQETVFTLPADSVPVSFSHGGVIPPGKYDFTLPGEFKISHSVKPGIPVTESPFAQPGEAILMLAPGGLVASPESLDAASKAAIKLKHDLSQAAPQLPPESYAELSALLASQVEALVQQEDDFLKAQFSPAMQKAAQAAVLSDAELNLKVAAATGKSGPQPAVFCGEHLLRAEYEAADHVWQCPREDCHRYVTDEYLTLGTFPAGHVMMDIPSPPG